MYIGISLYIYQYIYIYTYLYVYMHIYFSLSIYIHVHCCTCIYMKRERESPRESYVKIGHAFVLRPGLHKLALSDFSEARATSIYTYNRKHITI